MSRFFDVDFPSLFHIREYEWFMLLFLLQAAMTFYLVKLTQRERSRKYLGVDAPDWNEKSKQDILVARVAVIIITTIFQPSVKLCIQVLFDLGDICYPF